MLTGQRMTSSWAGLQLQLGTSCSVQPRHPMRAEQAPKRGRKEGWDRCYRQAGQMLHSRVSVAAEGGQRPRGMGHSHSHVCLSFVAGSGTLSKKKKKSNIFLGHYSDAARCSLTQIVISNWTPSSPAPWGEPLSLTAAL